MWFKLEVRYIHLERQSKPSITHCGMSPPCGGSLKAGELSVEENNFCVKITYMHHMSHDLPLGVVCSWRRVLNVPNKWEGCCLVT